MMAARTSSAPTPTPTPIPILAPDVRPELLEALPVSLGNSETLVEVVF